jgi:hypothetical protein
MYKHLMRVSARIINSLCAIWTSCAEPRTKL